MNNCNRWGKKHIEALALARAMRKQTKHLQHHEQDARRDIGQTWIAKNTEHDTPEPVSVPTSQDESTTIAIDSLNFPPNQTELVNTLHNHKHATRLIHLLASLNTIKHRELPYVPTNIRIPDKRTYMYKGIQYRSCRLKWMQYYEREPLWTIDHINGDTTYHHMNNMRDIPFALHRLRLPNKPNPYADLTEDMLTIHTTYYADLPPEKWVRLYHRPRTRDMYLS